MLQKEPVLLPVLPKPLVTATEESEDLLATASEESEDLPGIAALLPFRKSAYQIAERLGYLLSSLSAKST